MECKQNDAIRFTSGYYEHKGVVQKRDGDLLWVLTDEGEQYLTTIKFVIEVVE